MVQQVISGGQTGIDQIGLKVARKLGIKTGGVAPKGFRTENGNNPKLAEYGLTESFSSDYTVRTKDNVQAADATVLFGDMKSPGSLETIKLCRKFKKPFACNPSVNELMGLFLARNVKILNVAGNRGSKLTDEQRYIAGTTLYRALQNFNSLTITPCIT